MKIIIMDYDGKVYVERDSEGNEIFVFNTLKGLLVELSLFGGDFVSVRDNESEEMINSIARNYNGDNFLRVIFNDACWFVGKN